MTREDIIRMAREAGFIVGLGSPAFEKHERFAALVAAHESEECARVCIHNAELYDFPNVGWESSMECAAAIRNRRNI